MGLTQPRLRNVETAEQVTLLIAALAPDFASIYAIPEPPILLPLRYISRLSTPILSVSSRIS